MRAMPTEIGWPSSARTRRQIALVIFGGRTEQIDAASDVGNGRVNRNSFDERREVIEQFA